MISCIFENGARASLRHVVVDVIISDKENNILLIKRASNLIEGGKWACVGGFVDRDETVSNAVKREVREETGWEIKKMKLFRIKDSPNRPNEDRQNIAFTFICQAEKKVGHNDSEVEEVKWFRLNNLPKEIAFDHLEDIELYRKYLVKKYKLPLIFE